MCQGHGKRAGDVKGVPEWQRRFVPPETLRDLEYEKALENENPAEAGGILKGLTTKANVSVPDDE